MNISGADVTNILVALNTLIAGVGALWIKLSRKESAQRGEEVKAKIEQTAVESASVRNDIKATVDTIAAATGTFKTIRGKD